MTTLKYVPSTMCVVQRSVMYTPGNNEKLLEKAATFLSDVVVLDLEDSVAPTEKMHAREITKKYIPIAANSGGDVYVRLNAYDTDLTDGDLDAVVQPLLNGVVLSKTESAHDVERLDKKLTELEKRHGMKVGSIGAQLLIETSKGVMNVWESARAAERVNSLVFGAVDYTRDMRVKLTPGGPETMAARSIVAIAARAAKLVAIDPPWAGFADTEGFAKDCILGRQLGYEGRMLIHPNQILPSHDIYAPQKEDVEAAREVVQLYEEAISKGMASIALRGKMIDWAIYRAEKDLIAKVDIIAAKEQQKVSRRKTA